MSAQATKQKVLVIGAGRGGTAMLELFSEDPSIQIVGIVDNNSAAPALLIATELGVPHFTDVTTAIQTCQPCLAFNLTGDDSVSVYAESKLGTENVVGGFQARFLWTLLTRLKQTNEQVTHLAHHDGLTGLPNRTLFYDRLNQAIARARRDKESVAVLFLDLDGFKKINDTLGHDIGDALLIETAKRIKACVRESDTVARMGGDEFTAILCKVGTANGKDIVAQKILDAIRNSFNLSEKSCAVGVSIGIAVYPDSGDNAEDLVKVADTAMYLAKDGGKNCYRFLGT
ncbi:MAG: diguanylate cyclase [Sideroxydans sp.]|jgi:diguanylate cyclase (GGDEF)-like protein